MSAKWNMIVDIERCNNCRACFLAVKDEHTGNDFPGYAAEQPAMGANWLDIQRKERGSYPVVDAHFMPVMCNHCDDAPCMKAATNDAVRKRPDGIVIIDPEKAKGQKQIVDACPYGAVSWNEELQIPQAGIFDAQLLDEGWLGPDPVPAVYRRVGDVVLAARGPVGFVDPTLPYEANLMGAHGSITEAEVQVPLVAARGRSR